MKPKVPREDSNYHSVGKYAATAKALNEIIVPSLHSIHEDLIRKGFEDGDFSIRIGHKYMEHVAAIRIKTKTGGTSSLTFKYDASKGGLKVEEVVKSRQKVTVKSATRITCKTSSVSKAHHIQEADLTKPVLEKAISDFINNVVKSNK